MKPYGLNGKPLTCPWGCCYHNADENKHLNQWELCKRRFRKKARRLGKKEIEKEIDNDSQTEQTAS